MLILQANKNREHIFSYALKNEETSIGRSPTCDIWIPDPTLSRTHARIVNKKGVISILDSSKNGSFVNSQRIFKKHELDFQDKIQIGDWVLRIKNIESSSEKEITVIKQKSEATHILSYQAHTQELRYQRAWIESLQPPFREHPLHHSFTSIGKAHQNHIVLHDDYISAVHCIIEEKEGAYSIRDLSSTNGTLLGGQRVYEAALSSGDVIALGKLQFRFGLEFQSEKIKPSQHQNFFGILSKDPGMKQVFSLIKTLKQSHTTVLLHGETGSGKELFARAIHHCSPRKDQSLITVNCGAISKELIESELFGHEKGAFTSAFQHRKGLFEAADRGSIFLDEIAELPLALQSKLLRVLESGEIRKVGSSQTQNVDVRVIAATHKNLAHEVKAGRFREDLFYRLHVIPIHIPPLRDRTSDILMLSEAFLSEETQSKKLSPAAMKKLSAYSWPGNVRELKHVLRRAFFASGALQCIEADHIHFAKMDGALCEPSGSHQPSNSRKNMEHSHAAISIVKPLTVVEKEAIAFSLHVCKGNKTKTAKNLDIAKSTLHQKIKKYGL